MATKLTETAVAAAIATALATAVAPVAWAEGDPHVPDGPVNWCPGGQGAEYGGARFCNGESYADGTFYRQSFHATATLQWVWEKPTCSYMIPGNPTPQTVRSDADGCDGRGRFLGAPAAPSTPAPYRWQEDPGQWRICPPDCPGNY